MPQNVCPWLTCPVLLLLLPHQVRRHFVKTRENTIVNRLNKTKREETVDFEAVRMERQKERQRAKREVGNELVSRGSVCIIVPPLPEPQRPCRKTKSWRRSGGEGRRKRRGTTAVSTRPRPLRRQRRKRNVLRESRRRRERRGGLEGTAKMARRKRTRGMHRATTASCEVHHHCPSCSDFIWLVRNPRLCRRAGVLGERRNL